MEPAGRENKPNFPPSRTLESDLRSLIEDTTGSSDWNSKILSQAYNSLKIIKRTAKAAWKAKTLYLTDLKIEYPQNNESKIIETLKHAQNEIEQINNGKNCRVDLELAKKALIIAHEFQKSLAEFQIEDLHTQEQPLNSFCKSLMKMIENQEKGDALKINQRDLPTFTYDENQTATENIARFKSQLLAELKRCPGGCQEIKGISPKKFFETNPLFRTGFADLNLLDDPIEKLKGLMTLIYEVGSSLNAEIAGDAFLSILIDLFCAYPEEAGEFITALVVYTPEDIARKHQELVHKPEKKVKRQKLEAEKNEMEEEISGSPPGAPLPPNIGTRLNEISQEIYLLDATNYIFTQFFMAVSTILITAPPSS